MWRRVPCERQLNMGQSVLRDTEKSVTQSQIEIYILSLYDRCLLHDDMYVRNVGLHCIGSPKRRLYSAVLDCTTVSLKLAINQVHTVVCLERESG